MTFDREHIGHTGKNKEWSRRLRVTEGDFLLSTPTQKKEVICSQLVSVDTGFKGSSGRQSSLI